jgi:type IV pilus assembly protein PilB
LSAKDLKDLEQVLGMPQGIILVTGPTGSGKSSTLYAFLNRLNSPDVNIITVEDPIEFEIPGINQVQINPKAGITFAAGLRSILRQDPDIVMVGEIRDAETATTACQAAQTGHLVFSTLHTNDAPSAVTRLLDLGVEPFQISDSLQAVVAQRLVRRICPECKIPDPLSPQILKRLSSYVDGDVRSGFWKGAGCETCQYTGYIGRLGLFTVLKITPSLRELIARDISTGRLTKAAEKDGYHSLTADGIKKALQGLTTIEEVFRVAPPGAEDAFGDTISKTPLNEEDEGETVQPEEHRSSLVMIRPRRILVADDNAIILKVLRNLLEAEGFQVITVQDGLEALKLTLQERPDLVITDILMPRMDGVTFIKKLKSQLATRYIPVIMLTAKDGVEAEVEGIGAGANDYLTKPVNPKRLLARVHRILDQPGPEEA